jgi:cytochrome bd-type quinol oxidase subunit 2
MTRSVSATRRSLMLTTGSFLLGLISIALGRRVNYLDHLPVFNVLAAAMLVLVVVAVVVAFAALVRSRGRGASLWLAATMGTAVLGIYLLDR